MMPTLVHGNELAPARQREALRSYVARYTGDHKPQWARQPMPNGNAYPVQFADDAEWLANTQFWVTKTGRLAANYR